MMAHESGAPTERARVRRLNELAAYDRDTIHAILDAMPMCTVGYVFDGAPYVTPTLQWREGDDIYWHGSSASRMLRASEGAPVCLNVTLLDGIVLARSAFNHSTNYRSAMLFGTARKIEDTDEKEAHLKTFMDLNFPGRWETLRPVTAKELKATTVLTMPIDEASAKISAGPPDDDEADFGFPTWAGVLPIRMVLDPPEPCPRLLDGIETPDHVFGVKIG